MVQAGVMTEGLVGSEVSALILVGVVVVDGFGVPAGMFF